MLYEILIYDDPKKMEEAVQKYMVRGWKVQGSVSVVYFREPIVETTDSMPVFRFYQAMTKQSAPQN